MDAKLIKNQEVKYKVVFVEDVIEKSKVFDNKTNAIIFFRSLKSLDKRMIEGEIKIFEDGSGFVRFSNVQL